MFLVLHLILVVKQQNQVLEGHCCHPIFNSPLCVKITISLKWTITALLSMVAQVFLLNQFIILQFVLRKECIPRCRLGSWLWLSHIPFLLPICCREEDERMRESVVSLSFLISLPIWQATSKKWLSQPGLSLLPSVFFHARRSWHEVVIWECSYKVCSTHPWFPAEAKQGNGTQPLFV